MLLLSQSVGMALTARSCVEEQGAETQFWDRNTLAFLHLSLSCSDRCKRKDEKQSTKKKKKKRVKNLSFVFVMVGGQTQGFGHARQGLYH